MLIARVHVHVQVFQLFQNGRQHFRPRNIRRSEEERRLIARDEQWKFYRKWDDENPYKFKRCPRWTHPGIKRPSWTWVLMRESNPISYHFPGMSPGDTDPEWRMRVSGAILFIPRFVLTWSRTCNTRSRSVRFRTCQNASQG